MSRALRRQLERDYRRNIDRSDRVVGLPSILDEFTVFDVPQRILDQISNGFIDAAQGVPVFRDNAGVLNEVVPALSGWIFTWQQISDKLNLNLALQGLDIVCKRLNSNTPLTDQIVQSALNELNQCRQAFRICDRKEIVSIAKTAQIQILIK